MSLRIKYPRIGWRDADDAFTVVAGANRICFTEGGTLLGVEIAPGTYSDLELAWLIKIAMDAAGGSYAVWRDGETGLFQICRLDSASGFDLNVVGCGSSLYPELGFTTDHTGGACYSADQPTPAMIYLDLSQPVREPAMILDREKREDHRAWSGRRWASDPYTAAKKWSANLRFENYTQYQAFFDFMSWALMGAPFRWWPDQDDPHRWVLVQMEKKVFDAGELLPWFKNWDFRIEVAQAGNNTGTIELEELQDR